MGKLIGSAKTGGRKKGTPNKSSLLLKDSLEKLGIDVVAKLGELMPKLDVNKQADVYLALMSYLFPKRKAIEIVEAEPPESREITIQIVNSDGTYYDPETQKTVSVRKTT